MFNGEESIKFDSSCHTSAIKHAKEKIDTSLRNPESKAFKTSVVLNFNRLFCNSVVSKIGETTGVEVFKSEGKLFLRLLRKAVFQEAKKVRSTSGGCMNLTDKFGATMGYSSLRATMNQQQADEVGLQLATRYVTTYDSEDTRGLIYEVKLNSLIDRSSDNNRILMELPGFTVYGHKKKEK